MEYIYNYKNFKINESWVEDNTSFDENAEVGKRIRFISSTDKWSKLKEGDEGTIQKIDDLGTIFVKWDSGSGPSGLIPNEDEYEILD